MSDTFLSARHADQLADTFHLLGDANRLRLVCTCLHEAVSVQELAQRLELSTSLVSHHLRLLRSTRLMRTERRGKRVYYRVADAHVQRVLEDMIEHVQEGD